MLIYFVGHLLLMQINDKDDVRICSYTNKFSYIYLHTQHMRMYVCM